MKTIAILGSGFSGTLLAVQLLRRAARGKGGVRVVLIERSGAFGPGLAYGHGSEALLLNVVAGRMSALPDEPDDFLNWAKGQDPSVKGEMFLPRRMFGRYLADLLGRAEREAGGRGELERVCGEARDVEVGESGVRVVMADGGEVRADHVVVATGNGLPARPRWCDDALAGSGRYIAGPWRGEPLARIGREERVLVVGTGLTMMDVVLTLRNAGHTGAIKAVSRRGLLSQAHRPGSPGLAKLPSPLFGGTFSNVRELLHHIRVRVREAEAQGGDWRDVINALRPITPELWAALGEREQRRFMDHLLPFWNTHRHRSPPSVADGVEAMRVGGQLRVHAGRIVGAEVGEGCVRVRVAPRGCADRERDARVLEVEWVVNCTGPAADVRVSGDGVVGAMVERGVARPGPLGMGLDFDDQGRLVGASGEPQSRVWLVGPARLGRHWEATAVPELREQAAAVAGRLLGAGDGVAGEIVVGVPPRGAGAPV